MPEQKKAEEEDRCTHPLMCADEWEDPEGAKVIGEYHKDDLGDDGRRLEEDLDAFEGYWRKKHGINLKGEYHKEGAPYLEEPSQWDGHLQRAELNGRAMAQSTAMTRQEREGPSQGPIAAPIDALLVSRPPEPMRPQGTPAPSPEAAKAAPAKEKGEPLRLTEVVDINSLEVIAYWVFRLAFGRELHVPIKKEGVADIDVHIKNKDVTINTNQLYFSFPELVVWHVTYAHKGRPVLEIGRGVKKGMKVHRINALRLLMEVWLGSRRSEKAKDAVAPTSTPRATKSKEDLEGKGDIT